MSCEGINELEIRHRLAWVPTPGFWCEYPLCSWRQSLHEDMPHSQGTTIQVFSQNAYVEVSM